MAAPQDVWKISGEDRAKHDAQFFQLKPVNGFVTGNQARDFFMQSGLATQVLGTVWGLADVNGDGKMDKKEFSIAMHLIKKKLQGYELPKALPASLKADPTPTMGSFAQPVMAPPMGQPMQPNMGMTFPMGGMPMAPMGMMQPQASLATNTMTTGAVGMPRMANGNTGNVPAIPGMMAPVSAAGGPPAGVQPIPGGSVWAIPHSNKLKYTQVFNGHDRNKRGYLLGNEARTILISTHLPQHLLAQIWTLADVDKDGKLTCDEFCIALHLSELAKMGHVMPATLPAELLPTKTRSGSITSPPSGSQPATPKKDGFGELLGGMGMPQQVPVIPAAPEPAEETAADKQVTLEDKRRENFDKGQAELERRRAILREQQQKEEMARQEKERQEAEKRERQRIEAENKRMAELQRQLEKQREKEREIEEQRRQMQEHREAARRELERQRQMEWEKQRKEQLLSEKQREYEQLSILKTQMATLKAELESLDGKKSELSVKITQVQGGVTDFTTSIDAMRVSRDRTLADIDVYDKQMTELNKKKNGLSGQRDELSVKVETAQTTPLGDAYKTVMNSVEQKRGRINKLKTEVASLESDTEARLGEIDCTNAELKNLQHQLSQLEKELPQLKKLQEERNAQQKKVAQELQQKNRQEEKKEILPQLNSLNKTQTIQDNNSSSGNWFDFNNSDAQSSGVNWDSAFTTSSTNDSSAFPSTGTGSVAWTSNGSVSGGKTKYRVLFDFQATREDELTLYIGDEVWVSSNSECVAGMEDWFNGEKGGTTGWFPKAYVELVEDTTSAFGSAFEPVQATSTPAAPTSTTGEPDLFGSQFSEPSTISADRSVDVVPGETSVMSETAAGERLLAKATYPWKARQDTDLTFEKDDTIVVTKQEEMRWYGELNGKAGWFPKAYVKLIGVAPNSSVDSSADAWAGDTQEYNMPPSTVSLGPLPVSAATSSLAQDGGEYYIAMYTYTSDEPADLVFNEGDIIQVNQATGDWWTGTLTDKGTTGIFPANYVKKLEIQPEQKSAKKPEIARVIAPYVATGTGQLSLEVGNLINVRQKSPRGWWEGELQVRGQKKKIGWFPANYVKLLGSSSARSTPEPTASSALSVGLQSSRSATPQSTASQDGVLGINQQETVVALYAYAAQNSDELTFQKDDVITVLARDNPDWWSGQLNGVTGVFPSNYVTPNPQSQSWMNDTVQEELTKVERKRQQVIQELINTEETYNTDMLIALDIFKKPLIEGNIIPKEQVDQIFVNWEELIVCNKKLLQALRVRKKMVGKKGVIMIIGDILCESLPHMNPYMRFCSCQLTAAAVLQRVSESSTSFQEFHKTSMQNPTVKGVHLSGYLLKPMQRITRYPLLIEKILANTPPDHADRNNLEESLTLAQELCAQANQCVKERQNSDCLEWIQRNVHCDGLAENITFNSLTNCLGPRRLIYSGILYKAKSNKELVGFLFNDFLLLASTSRPLGSTYSTVKLFESSLPFKMYRSPIFLNEVIVKKSSDEAEPTQFHITTDRSVNLKAVSGIERETWIKEIENASKQYKDKAKRKLERAHSVRQANVGRILVVIQEASHLKASDANGKSDPYCEVNMGSQEHRTKVIASTLNPRWNASMQFLIRDVARDTLCFTVYDRDLYSPNDFLGRTEVRIQDVLTESGERRGPITKRLILHEVETGEVVVKLDLQLYSEST